MTPANARGGETIIATLLAAECVQLPDGRQFRGLNCETDAARALLAGGHDPAEPLAFQWSDGRASTAGTIGAYARWRLGEDGRQRWKPHPQAETGPHLVNWAAKIASEAKATHPRTRRAA